MTPVESLAHHNSKLTIQEISALHNNRCPGTSQRIASAPATWTLIGDGIDHSGGTTLVSVVHLRTVVVASPRLDEQISVHVYNREDTNYELVSSCSPVHLDRTATKGPVTFASRMTSIANALIQRQMLSRDTRGFDITVLNDIPQGAGLGSRAAIDTAFALAVAFHKEDLHNAPIRAKLADILYHTAVASGDYFPLRARYTAMIRGQAEMTNIIDYGDFSVTQAAHPTEPSTHTRAIVVMAPEAQCDGAGIKRRELFFEQATKAFAAESLRLLPDAQTRVMDWLRAIHRAGAKDLLSQIDPIPSLSEARNWLHFYATELELVQQATAALRSRRLPEIYPILTSSQHVMSETLNIPQSERLLAELLMSRGALAARAARAGVSPAVIAIIPDRIVDNMVADLRADGLFVSVIDAGQPARLER
ncbi:galactokinase family protein [Corynebacterium sp. ES2715-CONJ3]|uniref:galactokinase family protein n=1 Tax=Corynebacterium sp. ES2715-CONJ3 TaxID=2974028 RepID=UPI002168C1E5|nr:galactokinase family protein [Corynebacterium sp. ES2715-CONJ3]MCS4492395.1 galactokinase [Corynebacterium sp. ES2715-CONJ3]